MVGATIFPHNIGLGATRDADLVRRIGRATAQALCATGVYWNFAPCVAVPQDIRWGRTYEGFSEQTRLVTELGTAYLAGLQADDLGSAGSVLPVQSWAAPSISSPTVARAGARPQDMIGWIIIGRRSTNATGSIRATPELMRLRYTRFISPLT